MAAEAITDGHVEIAGVDISEWVTDFSVTETYDEQQTTAMGDTHHTRVAGVGDGTLSITYHNDFASSATYETLQPLVGTVATFACKKDSGTTTTSNPQVSGSVLITELPHFDISHGQVHTVSVSYPNALGTGFTRANS